MPVSGSGGTLRRCIRDASIKGEMFVIEGEGMRMTGTGSLQDQDVVCPSLGM